MDIYKFSRGVKDESVGSRSGESDGAPGERDGALGERGMALGSAEPGSGMIASAELVVTDLKQGVKNPERVNVYINGKFGFSLDIAQVVDLKIKKGLILSKDRYSELKEASEFGKLYQRTLEWVLVRPRSERETRDYLKRKIFEKKLGRNFSDRVVAKLKAKKYLDDLKFAEYYVENRFVKKGISLKRLKMELLKKGVAREIVEQVLVESPRDEAAEIQKMILKKRNKYDDEKLTAYLLRQGFQYDLVRELVRQTSEKD